MVWIIIFFACLVHYGFCEENVPSSGIKIVGGMPVTDRTAFPYQVSLRYKKKHFCGGTIIDSQHIITAAHCCFKAENEVYPPKKIVAYVGDLQLSRKSRTTQYYPVKHIFTHANYSSKSISNDIAILRLKKKLTLNAYVKPLSLSMNLPVAGTRCNASGWGVQQSGSTQLSETLRYVDIPILAHMTCRKKIGPELQQGMFCAGNLAGGQDSCQGDSGGPLVCNSFSQTTLVGVISWGYGCAHSNLPGVYTDISDYVDWIEKEKLRSNSNKRFSSIFNTVLMLILNYFILYKNLLDKM